ncbi:MAG TPA: DUF2141 domain-containing protein [Ignavibacteriaceae bacterium]|nr:DUF2141 domain-containing protein [Ignavibacteriaceae bacterium]
MKNLLILILLLISIAVTNSYSSMSDKQRGKLIVKFDGVKNNDGFVKIALCNSADNYKIDDKPFIGKNIKVEDKSVVIEFSDLPFGEYAVKAFHDENGNDDLDTNFLGIPKEEYGFSNNARAMFGPPSWDSAKFKFTNENQIIEITLK